MTRVRPVKRNITNCLDFTSECGSGRLTSKCVQVFPYVIVTMENKPLASTQPMLAVFERAHNIATCIHLEFGYKVLPVVQRL